MADPVPVAVPGITDPELVRVLLYASGKPVHAPLVGVSRAALNVSDFALTLLDDASAAAMRATLGANDAGNLNTGTLAEARAPYLTPDKGFRRGNIIGPVSQIGGLPTGALTTGWIQTVNGWYKRNADGTQTCFVTKRIFLDTALYQYQDLPAAFLNNEYGVGLTFAQAATSGANADWVKGCQGVSTHIAPIDRLAFLYQQTSLAASGNAYATLTGRWF